MGSIEGGGGGQISAYTLKTNSMIFYLDFCLQGHTSNPETLLSSTSNVTIGSQNINHLHIVSYYAPTPAIYL